MKRALWASLFLLMGARVCAEFPIIMEAGNQQNPAVYGSIVVWQDDRGGNWDIVGYDLAEEREFVICNHTSNQTDPDIYKQYVVWKDTRNGNGDIYGYNLDTRAEFVVTTHAAEQANPAIHENNGSVIVVYDDLRQIANCNDIWAKNLKSGSEFAVTTAAQAQTVPDICERYVVWQDNQSFHWDIYGRNLNSGGAFAVFSGAGNQQYPSISGTIVVWQDNSGGNWDIKGKNLSNGASLTICTAAGNQTRPAIYGDLVVWQDDRGGDWDIVLYRLSSQEERAILAAPAAQEMPAVGEGILAWQDQRAGGYDLFGFQPEEKAEIETAAEIGEGVYSDTTAGARGMDLTEEGYYDFRDVWYLFTAEQTGTHVISLCGSEFDTTLAVFDLALVEMAFNDDYCGLGSRLVWKAVAGRSYYIRIAGYDGAAGDYRLEVVSVYEPPESLTKLPGSSYYQGTAPYTFFLYPEPTAGNPEPQPEALLSGRIEFAVYDTTQYPEESPGAPVAGTGRYIYAYQVFNGAADFLGLPQEALSGFMIQGPAPCERDISAAEDPAVIVYPEQTVLWAGSEPTESRQNWGLSCWRFDNPITPGGWSWYLFLRSDFDYSTAEFIRVNDSVRSGAGLPVPADEAGTIADFDEDGLVDYSDFAVWTQGYLAEPAPIPVRTDLNIDGLTDVGDLELFLDRWMWEGL